MRKEDVLSLIHDKFSSRDSDFGVLDSAIREAYLSSRDFPFLTRSYILYFSKKEDVLDDFKQMPGNLLVRSISREDTYESESHDFLFEHKTFLYSIQYYRSTNYIVVALFGTLDEKDVIKKLFIKRGFSDAETEKDSVTISFASPSRDGGVKINNKSFVPIKFESIKQNYMLDVQNSIIDILPVLEKALNGLVIIHGSVGTGKTYLIRAILSELINTRRGMVCIPPSNFLYNLDLLNQAVVQIENPIVILEDFGEVFRADSAQNNIDAFSNLANMTDGLMSLVSNTIFILTFNYDVGDMHPALTRHGRCLMNLNVPKLSYEAASHLVENLSADQTSYSLADIFAIKQGKKSIKDKGLFGFATLPKMRDRGRPAASYH